MTPTESEPVCFHTGEPVYFESSSGKRRDGVVFDLFTAAKVEGDDGSTYHLRIDELTKQSTPQDTPLVKNDQVLVPSCDEEENAVMVQGTVVRVYEAALIDVSTPAVPNASKYQVPVDHLRKG
jgi:hypothetical protein